jgi:hypothetical protein
MARFTIGAAELGPVSESSFEEFVAIAKGRSIVSAADWGSDRFELGLSGGAMLRVFWQPGDLEVNLLSTTNPGEVPPVVFALGNLPQRVRLSLIQRRLNGLRTLYAIFYLHQRDRMRELISFLAKDPNGDIEAQLLKDDETLQVESISYGSWLVTLWSQAKDGYKAIGAAASLVYERGREAFLRKQEAEARLLEAQADHKEALVAGERFKLQRRRVDYLLEVTERIDDPEMKRVVQKRLVDAAVDMVAGDRDETEVRRQLEGPP